jgi:hypothetical protein
MIQLSATGQFAAQTSDMQMHQSLRLKKRLAFSHCTERTFEWKRFKRITFFGGPVMDAPPEP